MKKTINKIYNILSMKLQKKNVIAEYRLMTKTVMIYVIYTL